MACNKMKINPEKTHILALGTPEWLRTLETRPIVLVDNVTIQKDPKKYDILFGCSINVNLNPIPRGLKYNIFHLKC